jgi:hypothetical protein
MIQPQVGELIVGAYLRIVEECDLVSYNQRSTEIGHQMELDVLGVGSTGGPQTVFGCEVVTHLNGMNYNGNPETDRWAEFGNQSYQYTLQRMWEKFEEDLGLLQEVFDDDEEYNLQLWSPVVPQGHLTDGFDELQRRFEAEHGAEITLVINGVYAERIKELRGLAAESTKSYDQPAFRFLQILEHLRED